MEDSGSSDDGSFERYRDCVCGAGEVFDILSRRYAIQVICAVGLLQPARYGEIEKGFDDVSSSTLSNRLEELTEEGLLIRRSYDEIPPRVEYSLTEDGEELVERLKPLIHWIEQR